MLVREADHPLPPLHAVTDDAVIARPEFVRSVAAVLDAGGADVALHLRAPGASGRRMHGLAVWLMELARTTRSWLIVNDRVDVALAAGAHGVQLGRRSIVPADARELVGVGMRIGVSVHSADEAREAVEAGADWLLAGSVYPTASHPGRPGAGTGLIESAAARGVAVIGIGGVTPERVREVSDAGAAGIAAIRGIWDHPSPGRAARTYIEAWQSCRRPRR
ncbi:MAG TPA: thiamine phosphate synthase [Longimicrobium sp.]|nr:thiamine phosphate synthase [Longimicrobium sp.]